MEEEEDDDEDGIKMKVICVFIPALLGVKNGIWFTRNIFLTGRFIRWWNHFSVESINSSEDSEASKKLTRFS